MSLTCLQVERCGGQINMVVILATHILLLQVGLNYSKLLVIQNILKLNTKIKYNRKLTYFTALWGTNRNSCFHKLSRPLKCVNFNVEYLLT